MTMTTRKRHSPEEVVRKLASADRMLGEGKDVADVCRELGVSEQTHYRWRNQFGGLKANDARRLKDLAPPCRHAQYQIDAVACSWKVRSTVSVRSSRAPLATPPHPAG
jgi:transposase-like protein